jgi:hypothetical protein
MRLACALIFLLTLAAAPFFCQDNANPPSAPTVPNLPDVNPQLLHLVIEDQWDCGNDMFSGRQVKTPQNLNVPKRDAERQAEVRKLLAEGSINTGRECYFAALIFQHSSSAENLLLAHMLAVTSVAKGNINGKWMSAATLDRYLWSINHPQVFGTQFQKGADEKWTMEPYDQTAVSDSIRASWCVVSLVEQEKILKDSQTSGPLAGTSTPDCK